MQPTLNKASILIPALNEEAFIEGCILSLIDGTRQDFEIEILVIDGGSHDLTRQRVEALGQKHTFIKLLHNPKKIVPAALNIGARYASHEYLIWCGAHAVYEPGYVEGSLKVHAEEHCASSGGVIEPAANDDWGQAIVVATSSHFGIGASSYRHATRRQEADTVFGGCFTKTSLSKIGGFNEAWVRNQDVEFNHRLRAQVGPIIVDPNIRCHYYCRDTLTGLVKQYYQYGYWRLRTGIKFPTTFTLKLFAPVLLTASTVAALLIASKSTLALSIPTLYFAVNVMVSGGLALHHQRPQFAYQLPIIFAALHYSWGLGFFSSAMMYALESITGTPKDKLK